MPLCFWTDLPKGATYPQLGVNCTTGEKCLLWFGAQLIGWLVTGRAACCGKGNDVWRRRRPLRAWAENKLSWQETLLLLEAISHLYPLWLTKLLLKWEKGAAVLTWSIGFEKHFCLIAWLSARYYNNCSVVCLIDREEKLERTEGMDKRLERKQPVGIFSCTSIACLANLLKVKSRISL